MTSTRYCCALLALALAACATSSPATPQPPASATAATPQAASAVVSIAERRVSAQTPERELDSIAVWDQAPDGPWLIVSGKSSHDLSVYRASDLQLLRTVGGKGSAPGEFKRPNGVFVIGDRVFVVERDNHRVQVMSLPEFAPLGSFGEDTLRSPYGIWMTQSEPGEYTAFITDSYMLGAKFDVVPPFEQLDQRVRRYRVQFDHAGKLRATDAGAFGDTHPETALRMVESIAGDPPNDRLLIADEDRRHQSTMREYDFNGRFTGRSVPDHSFGAEAEGIVLWTCKNQRGYWIAVDQLAPLTIFHLFDRATLAPVGSFQGKITAHTDGVALQAVASAAYPHGALYAVHDDKAIAAFDLGDVVRSLQLDPACG